ncbi:molecular chaperone DnaJ [Marinomonas agarivorans]|nr:molecular chaperone DnaJ [Marinomonas agarivorans]
MHNPLIEPVLAILEQNPLGISEYKLLKELDLTTQVFSELEGDEKLILFRKHFLIMNALYRLQTQLWQEDKIKLRVSPLNIVIEQQTASLTSSSTTHLDDATEAKLAAYYLDWNEYNKTQTGDVEALLTGFYRKLYEGNDTQKALDVLELSENCSKEMIKKAYRQRIKHAHPDKGGDPQHFIKLRRAYEHLLSLC